MKIWEIPNNDEPEEKPESEKIIASASDNEAKDKIDDPVADDGRKWNKRFYLDLIEMIWTDGLYYKGLVQDLKANKANDDTIREWEDRVDICREKIEGYRALIKHNDEKYGPDWDMKEIVAQHTNTAE